MPFPAESFAWGPSFNIDTGPAAICRRAVTPPLAMALMDGVVDIAIILKLKGKSKRAHRAKQPKVPDQ